MSKIPHGFAGSCPYCELATRSFLRPPRTSVVCDRLSGSGGGVLAKIAVELEQALARRAATGAAACHPTCRVLARGDGWAVQDLICASGPQDPIFEERHGDVSIAMVLAGTFQYRGSACQSFANGSSAKRGSGKSGSAMARFAMS